MQNNQYTKNITPAFVFGITLDSFLCNYYYKLFFLIDKLK